MGFVLLVSIQQAWAYPLRNRLSKATSVRNQPHTENKEKDLLNTEAQPLLTDSITLAELKGNLWQKE